MIDAFVLYALDQSRGAFCDAMPHRMIEKLTDALPFGCEVSEVEEVLRRHDITISEETNHDGSHWFVRGPGHELPPNFDLVIG